MKYSLMSLMVDDELRHEKTNFIIRGILESMGCTEVPDEADEAIRMLNERGVPMKNGTAGFEDLVRFTKEKGFDGLDMMSFQAELSGTEMKEILEKYDVTMSAMNILAGFSGAENEEQFQQLCKEVYEEIDKATEAGARSILLVVSGYDLPKGMTREKCFENIVRGLKAGADYGRKKGIPVSTETLESSSVPYCSIGEMKRIFEAVPELKYTHDTGNPLVANEDPLVMYGLLRERLISVHFKDLGVDKQAKRIYRCSNGETLALVTLGTGLVDYPAHLCQLKKDNYDGYITLEGGRLAENKWEEAVAALQYFRELEAKCCKDL